MNGLERHYAIGCIDISLQSDCQSFVDEYASLYGRYECTSAGSLMIPVHIRKLGSSRSGFGQFQINSPGTEGFRVRHRHEVLPHLEWMINWQVIRLYDRYVQFHAAALEKDGRTLMLPGPPGSGKSTLAAGLLARGWSYLCDEFALVDPQSSCVQAFPKALCIKEPSFAAIEGLGLPLARKTPYQKPTKGRVAYLNPLDIPAARIGRPSPVNWIVFPTYADTRMPEHSPMTRARAAFELARQCFNINVHQGDAVRLAAALARDALCARLTCGEIQLTCDGLEALLFRDRIRKAS